MVTLEFFILEEFSYVFLFFFFLGMFCDVFIKRPPPLPNGCHYHCQGLEPYPGANFYPTTSKKFQSKSSFHLDSYQTPRLIRILININKWIRNIKYWKLKIFAVKSCSSLYRLSAWKGFLSPFLPKYLDHRCTKISSILSLLWKKQWRLLLIFYFG